MIDLNLQRVLLETAQIGPDDVILEVGTGTGGLTMQMAPLAAAVVSAMISGYAGLVAAHQAGLPAGPAIILAAGALYLLSVVIGPVGGLIWLALPRRHLEA